jgi:putative endonuclease
MALSAPPRLNYNEQHFTPYALRLTLYAPRTSLMGKESYNLGIKGEDTACEYLKQQNFEIIERNFRSQQGEIDIIAKDKDCNVFVEVKAYSFRSMTAPIYAVRKSKRQSIIHAARLYVHQNKLSGQLCRFDVLAIYQKISGQTIIDHIRNAFCVS